MQIASAVVVFWYSSDVTNVVVVMLKQYNPDASSVSSSINQFIDITQESKTDKVFFKLHTYLQISSVVVGKASKITSQITS